MTIPGLLLTKILCAISTEWTTCLLCCIESINIHCLSNVHKQGKTVFWSSLPICPGEWSRRNRSCNIWRRDKLKMENSKWGLHNMSFIFLGHRVAHSTRLMSSTVENCFNLYWKYLIWPNRNRKTRNSSSSSSSTQKCFECNYMISVSFWPISDFSAPEAMI